MTTDDDRDPRNPRFDVGTMISLLQPNHNLTPKFVMAQVNIGGITTLNEETGDRVTLVVQPQCPFKVRKLIIRVASETIVFPWYIRLSLALFYWFRFPWHSRWDHDDSWWKCWHWIKPAMVWRAYWDLKLQSGALRNILVEDIRVNNTGLLIGPAPAEMFSAVAIGMDMHMPTCMPRDRIEVVLSGKGGPLAVVAVGDVMTGGNER